MEMTRLFIHMDAFVLKSPNEGILDESMSSMDECVKGSIASSKDGYVTWH